MTQSAIDQRSTEKRYCTMALVVISLGTLFVIPMALETLMDETSKAFDAKEKKPIAVIETDQYFPLFTVSNDGKSLYLLDTQNRLNRYSISNLVSPLNQIQLDNKSKNGFFTSPNNRFVIVVQEQGLGYENEREQFIFLNKNLTIQPINFTLSGSWKFHRLTFSNDSSIFAIVYSNISTDGYERQWILDIYSIDKQSHFTRENKYNFTGNLPEWMSISQDNKYIALGGDNFKKTDTNQVMDLINIPLLNSSNSPRTFNRSTGGFTDGIWLSSDQLLTLSDGEFFTLDSKLNITQTWFVEKGINTFYYLQDVNMTICYSKLKQHSCYSLINNEVVWSIRINYFAILVITNDADVTIFRSPYKVQLFDMKSNVSLWEITSSSTPFAREEIIRGGEVVFIGTYGGDVFLYDSQEYATTYEKNFEWYKYFFSVISLLIITTGLTYMYIYISRRLKLLTAEENPENDTPQEP